MIRYLKKLFGYNAPGIKPRRLYPSTLQNGDRFKGRGNDFVVFSNDREKKMLYLFSFSKVVMAQGSTEFKYPYDFDTGNPRMIIYPEKMDYEMASRIYEPSGANSNINFVENILDQEEGDDNEYV